MLRELDAVVIDVTAGPDVYLDDGDEEDEQLLEVGLFGSRLQQQLARICRTKCYMKSGKRGVNGRGRGRTVTR